MATYCYLRVSTDEQVKGCEIQADLCRTACIEQKLGEPIVYSDDGVSTSKVKFNDRPGMRKLLSILKKDDHLVVWRLDRIERGFLSFYDSLSQIVNKGVWIHSVEERGGMSIDLSCAAGRAMLAIWQIASDFYREQIQTNTRQAIMYRKRVGLAHARPARGFRIKQMPPGPGEKVGKKIFVPVDPQAVQEIVTRRDAGESWYSIATDFYLKKRSCLIWIRGKAYKKPWVSRRRGGILIWNAIKRTYIFAKYIESLNTTMPPCEPPSPEDTEEEPFEDEQ